MIGDSVGDINETILFQRSYVGFCNVEIFVMRGDNGIVANGVAQIECAMRSTGNYGVWKKRAVYGRRTGAYGRWGYIERLFRGSN